MSEVKIIVADDDASQVALLERLLASAGHTVLTCDNGATAFELVQQHAPVLLIADWEMPGLTGLELCRKIRASHASGGTYILLLTGHNEETQIVAGFEAGADDYLVKPVHSTELLARIRAGERILQLVHQQREYANTLESEITERKRAEQELVAAKADAEEALAKLQRIHAQLLQADKMASIGNLAAGVAHEINNPIGFITSNLNSLSEYATDLKRVLAAHDELLCECQSGGAALATRVEEVVHVRKEADIDYVMSDLGNLIAESTDGAKRVRQIVADLRDFSHVDSPDVVEEDINQLLDKTISVAWNELKYKTEVVREYGDIPVLPCYGGRLGQVFLNLLVNAAQAIEERGTITVRTFQQDSHVCIEVADTGCGIAPENVDRIFDPFFTTKDVGKGTGLGLHLACTIVKAHGGQITVESRAGEGTTFRIEVPLSGPPETQEDKCESVA